MDFEYFGIETWPRKNAFNFYKDFDDPYFNTTINIDVTNALNASKAKSESFFLKCIYLSLKAANEIENFRMRISGDRVKLYKSINGGSTLFYDDESFGFCYYDFVESSSKFIEESDKRIQAAKREKSFDPSNTKEDLLYFSSLPWVQFTSIKHAQDRRINNSIPRISFGKYFKDKDRILMPYNVEVNHALMDGFHMGKFLDLLQKYLIDDQA